MANEALDKLEILGMICDPVSCFCGGQYDRCPLREFEGDDDPEMNISSDEGYDN